MNHSPKKKIWAGALAALLALFAAVVVAATPAKAVAGTLPGGVIDNLESNVYAAFGEENITFENGVITLKGSGTTYTLTKTITFESGNWTLDLNGNTINMTGVKWSTVTDKGAYAHSMIQVAKGATLTINGGEGTISSAKGGDGNGWSTLGVQGTCTVTSTTLSGGDVDAGNNTTIPCACVTGTGTLTLGEGVTAGTSVNSTTGDGNVISTIYAGNGSTLNINGATINAGQNGGSGDNNGIGIQAGNSGATSASGASNATVYFNSGEINANIGIIVPNTATVTMNEGAEITLYGSTAKGISIEQAPNVADTTVAPTVVVNGGTIAPNSGVSGATAVSVDPNYSAGGKAVATVTLNGGTFEAPLSIANKAGTTDGVVATVNGGTYSAVVDPSLLGEGVGAMGVSKKGQVTYYTNISQVPSNQTGFELTDEPIMILATGLQGEDGTEIKDTLTSLGLSVGSSGTDESMVNGIASKNVLWAIWYGSDPTNATAIFAQAKQQWTGTRSSGDNIKVVSNKANTIGLAWSELGGSGSTGTIPGSGALAPAGTWQIQIRNAANTSSDTASIDIAGLTLYNPTSVNSTSPSATAATTYYKVGTELEDVPGNPKTPDSGTALMTVGWYELTQVGTTTNYTAAPWGETEYQPTSAEMTTLVATYSEPPEAGNVTAELSAFSPASVPLNSEATTTLTLTVAEDSAGADLVFPSGTPNISNKKQLEPSQADVVNGVAIMLQDALETASGNGSITGGTGTVQVGYAPTGASAWADAVRTTWEASEDAPTVSGNTVTTTITVTPKYSPLTAGDVALVLDLTEANIGVEDAGSVGTNPQKPEVEQPAAILDAFIGYNVTVVGNGTVSQTVDNSGNVVLTATPTNGATFAGWRVNGSVISTTNPLVLSAIANGTTTAPTYTAVFEGGTPDVPTPTDTVDITRLYNPYLNGAHLLSASASEVATLKAAGWTVEGTAFTEYASASANNGQVVPVYRLYNPYNGDHFYTAYASERDGLDNNGWDYEGIAWYAPVNSNVGVTRLYNPYMTENAGLGNHLWSANYSEVSPLIGVGWRDEGRAWFAVSAPSA